MKKEIIQKEDSIERNYIVRDYGEGTTLYKGGTIREENYARRDYIKKTILYERRTIWGEIMKGETTYRETT